MTRTLSRKMKQVATFLLLAMSLVYSQGVPELTSGEEEDDTFKVFPDPSGHAYFQKGMESYYTRYFIAMKEPSVLAPLGEDVTRIFRFTLIPTFSDPLSVRVVESKGVLNSTSVKLKMDPGYRPGKILFNETQQLSKEQSKMIRSLLAEENFWKPLNEAEETLAAGGLDGSRWIFEVHDNKGYRMLDIWSPEALKMSDKELEKLGLNPNKIRDFLIYREAGNKVLKMGKLIGEG